MNYQKKYNHAKRACYVWMALYMITVVAFVLAVNKLIESI